MNMRSKKECEHEREEPWAIWRRGNVPEQGPPPPRLEEAQGTRVRNKSARKSNIKIRGSGSESKEQERRKEKED